MILMFLMFLMLLKFLRFLAFLRLSTEYRVQRIDSVHELRLSPWPTPPRNRTHHVASIFVSLVLQRIHRDIIPSLDGTNASEGDMFCFLLVVYLTQFLSIHPMGQELKSGNAQSRPANAASHKIACSTSENLSHFADNRAISSDLTVCFH